jgi:cell division protein FtsL
MPASEEIPVSSSSKKLPAFSLLLIVLLLGFAVFGQRGLLRALQFNRQRGALEAQVRNLEASNAKLRQEIEDLRSDRRTIEAIARRELGMVKDDEVVYQFSPTVKEAAEEQGKARP